MRAQVIGVVITGAQNVSAKNNPPFHFRSETFLTRAAVKIENVFRIFSTRPVTHAIEASEVRGSFRGGNNVINRDRVFSAGQRDLKNFRSQGIELFHRGVDCDSHLRIDSFDHVFLGHAQPNAAQIISEARAIIQRGLVERCGILRIITCDSVHDQRSVADGLCYRSNLVE